MAVAREPDRRWPVRLSAQLSRDAGLGAWWPALWVFPVVGAGVLMTRVREESERHGTRSGALIGLAATGGVITSAGFVLAGTFAVLATVPVIGWAEIGFSITIGVLLDTMIVRPVLVTALTLDIGRHFWWPSRLSHRADVPLDQLDHEPAVGVD